MDEDLREIMRWLEDETTTSLQIIRNGETIFLRLNSVVYIPEGVRYLLPALRRAKDKAQS